MDGEDNPGNGADAFHRRVFLVCCGFLFGYLAGSASVAAKQKAASYGEFGDGSNDLSTGRVRTTVYYTPDGGLARVWEWPDGHTWEHAL